MALRRHTHFTAAVLPKSSLHPIAFIKPQNCSENKKVYKVQAAFSPSESSLHKQKPRCRSNGIE